MFVAIKQFSKCLTVFVTNFLLAKAYLTSDKKCKDARFQESLFDMTSHHKFDFYYNE